VGKRRSHVEQSTRRVTCDLQIQIAVTFGNPTKLFYVPDFPADVTGRSSDLK